MSSGRFVAAVECAVPPGMELIAGGSEEHCVTALEAWTRRHPTPQYARGLVLEVRAEVVYEPGVGVYTVWGGDACGDDT